MASRSQTLEGELSFREFEREEVEVKLRTYNGAVLVVVVVVLVVVVVAIVVARVVAAVVGRAVVSTAGLAVVLAKGLAEEAMGSVGVSVYI